MAEYKSSTEEGKCIFCEIAKGRMSTPGIFWEDEKFMAFLSIFPSVEGFTVVIPKNHFYSDVLKMPDEELREFIIASKKVSNILLEYFEDVGRVGLIMEGTGVNHAHIKLIPMHGTGYMKKGIWKQNLSGEDIFYEAYPGYLSSNDGPRVSDEKIKSLAKGLRNVSLA